MEIKFVGTGGAFDYRHRNSAAIVWLRDMKILIDCGCDVFATLRYAGQADDFTHILITHLHDDHIGSMGSLLAYNTVVLNRPPLKLIYPTVTFREHLNSFMKFILKEPGKYIDFVPIDEVDGLGYIDTFGRHVPDFPTFGYYFKHGDQKIAYSGDLGDPSFFFEELLKVGLEGATVFHDVTFNEKAKPHAFYKEVAKHQDKFKVYAYHLDPESVPLDNTVNLVVNHPELLV